MCQLRTPAAGTMCRWLFCLSAPRCHLAAEPHCLQRGRWAAGCVAWGAALPFGRRATSHAAEPVGRPLHGLERAALLIGRMGVTPAAEPMCRWLFCLSAPRCHLAAEPHCLQRGRWAAGCVAWGAALPFGRRATSHAAEPVGRPLHGLERAALLIGRMGVTPAAEPMCRWLFCLSAPRCHLAAEPRCLQRSRWAARCMAWSAPRC